MTDEPGFVDQEGLRLLLEKTTDALRPLGLSIEAAEFSVATKGNIHLTMLCQVRPKAAKAAMEDREARDQFNRLLADQHEAEMRKKLDEMRDALTTGTLDKYMFGDREETCSHERKHPSGHCLDCGKGLGE